ncbi:hypothetical protein [Chryseobacterium indoltheticum]|uniref:hypothetical protein n=1 Tax=Chryseobacterium indoltheticum TaxID=254 RepID=UPI003F499087
MLKTIFIKGKNIIYKLMEVRTYLFLMDRKQLFSGCDSPDCKKYFLKEKENMEENSDDGVKNNDLAYDINLNNNNVFDKIIISKNSSEFNFKSEIDGKPFLEKNLFVIHYSLIQKQKIIKLLI